MYERAKAAGDDKLAELLADRELAGEEIAKHKGAKVLEGRQQAVLEKLRVAEEVKWRNWLFKREKSNGGVNGYEHQKQVSWLAKKKELNKRERKNRKNGGLTEAGAAGSWKRGGWKE